MKKKYYYIAIATALVIGIFLIHKRTFIRVAEANPDTMGLKYEAGYKGKRVEGIFFMSQKLAFNTSLMEEGDFTCIRLMVVNDNQVEMCFGTIVPDVDGKEGKGMFMRKDPVKYYVFNKQNY